MALIGTELRTSSSFHPESDGATERANRTVTQMLRQCVAPHQKDWATKLPAIEFAMNSARSETTGYTPFFPGVRTFAQKMREAILAAHDSILAARTKQTRHANRRRQLAPFSEGDMVYLSTENLRLPKGRARKLIPKFIGPAELKQRGLHAAFHASLLRIHHPNDDARFPSRRLPRAVGLGDASEWVVKEVLDHQGTGKNALFEVLWSTGDRSWLPFHEASHLAALSDYLEAQGVRDVAKLPEKLAGVLNDQILESNTLKSNYMALSLAGEEIKGDGTDGNSTVPQPLLAMPIFSFSEDDVARFRAFAATINNQTYNPLESAIPAGYTDYCVQYQHDPARRLPFVPGLSTVEVVVNGARWRVIAPNATGGHPGPGARVDSGAHAHFGVPPPMHPPPADFAYGGMMAAAPVAAGGISDVGQRAVDVLVKRFEATTEMREYSTEADVSSLAQLNSEIANAKRKASLGSRSRAPYDRARASFRGRGSRGPGRGRGNSGRNGELRFPNLSRTFNDDTNPSGSGATAAGEVTPQGTPSSASPNVGPPQEATGSGAAGASVQATGSVSAGTSTGNGGSGASSGGSQAAETTSNAQGSSDVPETDGQSRDELGDEDADHEMEEVLF